MHGASLICNDTRAAKRMIAYATAKVHLCNTSEQVRFKGFSQNTGRYTINLSIILKYISIVRYAYIYLVLSIINFLLKLKQDCQGFDNDPALVLLKVLNYLQIRNVYIIYTLIVKVINKDAI